ncbi:hypothetical protein WN51_09471 [Melipona quadrifasciata]|uniref:Uncharacterized protein n=1 Tax=Melipona quadrifasciata TaxID=166423 RepID=A0A0N0BIS9_9HYME|nr:hypothetical protein WN51_09471 [Melipona quadrifasciata]
MTSDSYSLRYQTECTQEEKQSLQDARESQVTGSTTTSPPRVLFATTVGAKTIQYKNVHFVSKIFPFSFAESQISID